MNLLKYPKLGETKFRLKWFVTTVAIYVASLVCLATKIPYGMLIGIVGSVQFIFCTCICAYYDMQKTEYEIEKEKYNG